MAVQFLVHLPDGTEYGPVDRDTLTAWHAEGRLPDDTLVWPDGAPEWVSVAAALGSAPAPGIPAGVTPGTAAAPAKGAPHASGAHAPTGRSAAPPAAAGVASVPGPSASHPAGPGVPGSAAGRPTTGRMRGARLSGQQTPASAFPLHRVLLLGGGLVVAVVLAVGAWSVFGPWLARRSETAAIQRQALPERRVEDREGGLVVDLPPGWVVLRAGNPYVVASDARLRFAQPSLPAFAGISMVSRPRLMDALDAHIDALLQERLPRQPSTRETGRADVQLGRGRGRLVRTRWEDGLAAMQGAIVAWADGYQLFALEAWAPESTGDVFLAQLQSLCRGLTPTGALAKRVDEAVERIALEVPELSSDSLRLLVAERMSQGQALDDVPQAAVVMVSRGLDALAPAEAGEMRTIYQQVWAPVPEAQRVRLAALLNALKAGRDVPPADLAQVREAVKVGVLALPVADRERLQELSGRAVRKSLLIP